MKPNPGNGCEQINTPRNVDPDKPEGHHMGRLFTANSQNKI